MLSRLAAGGGVIRCASAPPHRHETHDHPPLNDSIYLWARADERWTLNDSTAHGYARPICAPVARQSDRLKDCAVVIGIAN